MPAVVLSLSRVGEEHAASSGGPLYHAQVDGGTPRPFSLETGAQRPGLTPGEALRSQTGEALNADLDRALGEGDSLVLLAHDPALWGLPWEALSLGSAREVLWRRAPVRRAWPGARPAAQAPLQSPLGGRVALAWSRRAGPEWVISQAIADQTFQPWLEASTRSPLEASPDDLWQVDSLAALQARLREAERGGRPVTTLMLLAHGGRDGQGRPAILFEEGALAGEDLAAGLKERAGGLRAVALWVCQSAKVSPGGGFDSLVSALHRGGIEAAVAYAGLLEWREAVRLSGALAEAMAVDSEGLEAATQRARQALGAGGGGRLQLWCASAAPRPLQLPPYRGLEHFEARHEGLFHRDPIFQEAVARGVEAPSGRFVLVDGASGSGKSSLVLAGVLPALARRGWRAAVMRPGAEPLARLERALAGRGEGPLVLVVDQLEELLRESPEAAREPFARRLWALSHEEDLAVIATLREGFYGALGGLRVAPGLRLDAAVRALRVSLPRVSSAELTRAVEGPAERVGLRFDDGLAAQIVGDVEGEPGPLPALQFALSELWRRRGQVGSPPRFDPARARSLTRDVYTHLGGVGGALEAKADEVLLARRGQAGLPELQRGVALEALRRDLGCVERRLLLRLVRFGEDASSDTRRPRQEAELIGVTEDSSAENALGELVDGRLLVSRLVDGARVYELAHETLLRRWRTLRQWADGERVDRLALQQLEQLAALGGLLDAGLTAWAEGVLERVEAEASDEVRGFVARSRSALERAEAERASQARKLRRRLWVAYALIGLAATLAVVATVFAKRAREAETRTRDFQRVKKAEELADVYPYDAIRLLREVERPDVHDGWRSLADKLLERHAPVSALPLPGCAGRSGCFVEERQALWSARAARGLLLTEGFANEGAGDLGAWRGAAALGPGADQVQILDVAGLRGPLVGAVDPRGLRVVVAGQGGEARWFTLGDAPEADGSAQLLPGTPGARLFLMALSEQGRALALAVQGAEGWRLSSASPGSGAGAVVDLGALPLSPFMDALESFGRVSSEAQLGFLGGPAGGAWIAPIERSETRQVYVSEGADLDAWRPLEDQLVAFSPDLGRVVGVGSGVSLDVEGCDGAERFSAYDLRLATSPSGEWLFAVTRGLERTPNRQRDSGLDPVSRALRWRCSGASTTEEALEFEAQLAPSAVGALLNDVSHVQVNDAGDALILSEHGGLLRWRSGETEAVRLTRSAQLGQDPPHLAPDGAVLHVIEDELLVWSPEATLLKAEISLDSGLPDAAQRDRLWSLIDRCHTPERRADLLGGLPEDHAEDFARCQAALERPVSGG